MELSINKKFSTVLLTSTRQHFDLKDVDIVSIKDTLSKSNLVKNSYKLAHIKIIPGDESIASYKINVLNNLGFNVVTTTKDWKNDHESHGSGLIEDMEKVYKHEDLLKCDYCLHLENDWIFHANDLDKLLLDSINILESYPNIIYHRYTRIDQSDIVQRIGAKKFNEFYIVNREFAFNPFVARTRDMKYISYLVKKYQGKIHPHCEMAYEIAAKHLTGEEDIFSFTHNQVVEHIGWADGYANFIKNKTK